MAENNFIQNILSRLGAKSLIRFKCVCKSWNNIISSPSFQALHHRQSCRNLQFLFRIDQADYNPYENHHCCFSHNFALADIQGNIHGILSAKVHDPIKLVLPACFGLVCFATDTRIYLCNPSTHQLYALPPLSDQTSIAGFGLGYLNSLRRHKVVQLIYRHSQSSPNYMKIECSVFTLGLGQQSGYWRVLNENCPYLVEQFSHPAFAGETIYWKINRRLHPVLVNNNDFIVAFNIQNEKFQTITHPENWAKDSGYNSTQLVERARKLHMIQISASSVIIWMLHDPQNSIWTRSYKIDIRGIDRNIIGESKGFMNGKIIFSSSVNVVLYYDVSNKKFWSVRLPFRASEFTTYWESLSPLPIWSI